MRILILHDYGTLGGGAEVASKALRDGLCARGHQAMLFSSSARSAPGDIVSDVTCFGTTGRWRTALQCANPSAYLQLRSLLKSFRPDVVHVKMFLTQLSPLVLPLLQNVPAIYYAEWYRAVCPTGSRMLPDGRDCHHRVGHACRQEGCVRVLDWPVLMLQAALLRRWAHVFDAIVPVSQAVGAALRAQGIPAGDPIAHGIPITTERTKMSDCPRVVFAGRLVREKGVDLLLRAMAQVLGAIPSARLEIAGDGPERASLQSLASSLGIAHAVHFSGYLSRNESERRFDDAWVQVVCSRWAEPFGLVAVEAMMRGVAVIVSQGGGLGEIVEPGQTGLRVQRGSSDSLAHGMIALLSDPARAAEMGHAGRCRAVAHYSEPLMLERFENLYARILRAAATR